MYLRRSISPDGRTLATATREGIVRFWDAPSGLPLGPPATLAGDPAQRLTFLPGGDRLAMASDSLIFLDPDPRLEIAGDLAQVRRWAEARTGWAIDAAGTVARLHPAEWDRRRQELSAGFEEPADCSVRKKPLIATGTWRSP